MWLEQKRQHDMKYNKHTKRNWQVPSLSQFSGSNEQDGDAFD